jgi:hypothetical protein
MDMVLEKNGTNEKKLWHKGGKGASGPRKAKGRRVLTKVHRSFIYDEALRILTNVESIVSPREYFYLSTSGSNRRGKYRRSGCHSIKGRIPPPFVDRSPAH